MKIKTLLSIAVLLTALQLNAEIVPADWTKTGDLSINKQDGELIWGDYNNDGFMDAFQIANGCFSLFKNNGDNTFSDATSTAFSVAEGLSNVGALFFDCNADGNLDLLVAGWNSSSKTILYKNSGEPNYQFDIDTTQILSTVRSDKSRRFLSAVDYNNDGWIDLFTMGYNDASGNRVVALYKNNHGVLELQSTPVEGTTNFVPVSGGSLYTGDINNDGYADLLYCGYNGATSNDETYLYVNAKNGTFTKSTAVFAGIEAGEALFMDADNDGWQDIFLMGVGCTSGSWAWPTVLYRNNQDGTFTANTSTGIPQTQDLVLAVADVNNDNLPDIMVQRYNIDGTNPMALYYNNGDATFSIKNTLPSEGMARSGSVAFADYNNDNKPDYAMFGYSDLTGGWPAAFMSNTTEGTFTIPDAPVNVAVNYIDGAYKITWDAVSGVKYNVYFKGEDGFVYTYAPADLITGHLKVGTTAALISTNQITLALPQNKYTIGVAAVNAAYVSSAFTTINVNTPTALVASVLEQVRVGSTNNSIQINNMADKAVAYTLIALSGNVLESGVCNGNAQIVISDLSAGVYMLRTICGSQTKVCKLVVL